MQLKSSAPSRSVTDVGAGDYVKVGKRWHEITYNSAGNASITPREWTIHVRGGLVYGMWSINRYAKAEDLEEINGTA